jgi:hypothetical protein
VKPDEARALEKAARDVVRTVAENRENSSIDYESDVDTMEAVLAQIDARRFADRTAQLQNEIAELVRRRFRVIVKELVADQVSVVGLCEGDYSRCSRRGNRVVPSTKGGVLHAAPACFQHEDRITITAANYKLYEAVRDELKGGNEDDYRQLNEFGLDQLVPFARKYGTDLSKLDADLAKRDV